MGCSEGKRKEVKVDAGRTLTMLARANFPAFTDHKNIVRKKLSREVRVTVTGL